MGDADQMLGVPTPSEVNELVGERSMLRFAVAIFDGWADVQATVRELTAAGMAENSFNCLGLYRVLAPLAARPDNRMSLRDLPFSGDAELTSVTDGPLAACLAERLRMGAETLTSALGHWLIPRHAAQLQEAVSAGQVILWAQLFDNDDERRAYRSLLARSSNSVGVHDIVGA
jgi:hypothetical protein